MRHHLIWIFIYLLLYLLIYLQVDEVVGIMRTNVEKVLERDQKLSELDDRADALQQGASQFEQQAGKLKRKYWWKNLKVYLPNALHFLSVGLVVVEW